MKPELYPFKLKNDAERAFCRFAELQGYVVNKKGWPDFMCQSRSGEWFAVEVKPRLKDGTMLKLLKREQVATIEVLEARGIRCYVSDGDSLQRYDRIKHADESRRRKKKPRILPPPVPGTYGG